MSDSLLAGPIVRRATINRVCVWFATSQKIDVKLDIYDNNNPKKIIGSSNIDSLYTQRTQLGKSMYIYLLEARNISNKQFPIDTLLLYQLSTHIDGQNEPWDLSDLAYKGLELPSFFIAEQNKNILHGSCRKPHGTAKSENKKNNDALVLAANTVAENSLDITNRPGMLLLTGDQIYADDVAISLAATLREKAVELMGYSENLPTDQNLVNTKDIPLHGRKDFLKENNSGFSSGESENHLLSFGEYAAMYIYVFGNLGKWKVNHTWPQLVKKGIADTKKGQEAFEAQQQALLTFNKNLPKIRCLLANIPTYMMFDDHDVTDDWNITNAWYDNVKSSNLGYRVVSNALAAYWGFQACGNDPDNFNLDFKSSLNKHLLKPDENPDITEGYNLQLWRNHSWGFSIPCNPPIIAIDARTQRANTYSSMLPNLLDRYAYDWLVMEWSKLKTNPVVNNYQQPIIIASAPVLGVAAIELLQKILYKSAEAIEKYPWIHTTLSLIGKEGFLTNKAIYAGDIEAWASNKDSLDGLMDCLSRRMGIKECTFVSGDVHYGFTANGMHKRSKNLILNLLNNMTGKHSRSINPTIYCYQLTSSSLNNTPSPSQAKTGKKMSKFSNKFTNHAFRFALKNTYIHILSSQKTNKRSFAGCNIGLIEFDNGVLSKHTLKTFTDDDIVFNLPDIKHIESLKEGNP